MKNKHVNQKVVAISIIFAIVGISAILYTSAQTPFFGIEAESGTLTESAKIASDPEASKGAYVAFSQPWDAAYADNLAKLHAQTYRNRNRDNTPYLQTNSDELPLSEFYGPRSAYADPANTKGWKEIGIPPIESEGNFRVDCEFSHFAYDDPIIFPNQPNKSHLHMFFGNTDINAYTTYDTLLNSGGGTCNGMELNRTGYWTPAMIDPESNIRIPERALVYYKSFYSENYSPPNTAQTEIYPERLRIVSQNEYNKVSDWQHPDGYGDGSAAFTCISSVNTNRHNSQDTIPLCIGSDTQMLEMNIKFPTCWNGHDPTNYAENLTVGRHNGFIEHYAACPASHPHYLTTIEVRILYRVENGEDTAGWFIASDVNPATNQIRDDRGGSSHGDWWGGWNRETNEAFVRECNNKRGTDCGHGMLGGSTVNDTQYPALKYRDDYSGPIKISGASLYNEICSNGQQINNPSDLAYCTP